MTDASNPSLTTLLERLHILLAEPIDFAAADTQSIMTKVRLLTAAATYFNILTVTDFGGRAGPLREAGLLEQAIGAAFQTYQGQDPHPDPFDKAAMPLRGITQGHPFNDGNKWTGFLTTAYYLARMDLPLPIELDVDAAEALCMAVSAGELRDAVAIAEQLRHLRAEQ